MDIAEIVAVFRELNLPINADDDAWKIKQTGAWVIKHKALERLAGGLKVIWDEPTFIRKERDECVIMVGARLPNKEVYEWSIGEALINGPDCIGNYLIKAKQASYPYAMAEKRAKDRVIIKLAGLHGAYSDEEAEEFKDVEKREKAEVKKGLTGSRTLDPGTLSEQKPDDKLIEHQQPEKPAEQESERKVEADGAQAEAGLTEEGQLELDTQRKKKRDAMLVALRKLDTPGKISSWMANKKVHTAFEELGTKMTEEIKVVGRKLQADFRENARAEREKSGVETANNPVEDVSTVQS